MEEAASIQLLFERRNELTFGPVFKEKDFRQVASVLKRLREKGVEKDVDSCKSEVVTALKATSGFVWDDEKGMGVARETRREWNKLIKVCEQYI